MILVNRNHTRPFVTKDGSEVRSILDPSNAPVKNQSLAEATLQPGAATRGHRHPNSEEIYYVLSGHGAITVGDETMEVKPHDAVLMEPGAYHQLANTGEVPLVFLCCCAPPYSHQDTVME